MGVFDRTDHLAGAGHEQVVFCQDPASGLKAIIAIWSTALGPALGGTRFHPYATEDEAVADVLKLSRAMAYKAAVAGLDLGGGKAVIIGDPAQLKTEALLRAYGRFVQSLNGRYFTACDVGTFSEDMDHIARGRTVIVIAHRLAAVRHCDRIVGMTQGEIVEVGTHDDLIRRRNGLYARLWSLQTDQVSA